jgi:hypothetical protein
MPENNPHIDPDRSQVPIQRGDHEKINNYFHLKKIKLEKLT